MNHVMVGCAVLPGLVAMVMSSGCASSGLSGHRESEFKPIFNGKNLDGWVVWHLDETEDIKPDAFYADADGALACKGYDRYWIRYDRPLGDIVLRMEYKVDHNTNSGVVLRALPGGDPPFTGFEVQILNDAGQDPNKHGTGAIYGVTTPMYNPARPAGEWNDLEITTDGLKIRVVLNGLKVIDTDFADLTEPIGKFDFAYADMRPEGYLSLQDHGSQVWFRNIRLKILQ